MNIKVAEKVESLGEKMTITLEADKDLIIELKQLLKNLTKKKNKSFSYINEFGEKVVVINGKEFIEFPQKELNELKQIKDDFIDEEEAKKLLCIE